MERHGQAKHLPSVCNALAKRITGADPQGNTLRSRARTEKRFTWKLGKKSPLWRTTSGLPRPAQRVLTDVLGLSGQSAVRLSVSTTGEHGHVEIYPGQIRV